MNRHEGVSCDACLKGNFRGRRYKCLMCFDYDLCAQCYEQGATTTRHTTDHPMQCILTRSDFELYYGGEVITVDQPQSFTCPYCGKMGFTDTTLQEHVSSEHADSSFEVVCPICASMIGGDPNMVTDDLASHLAVEHRAGAGGSGGSGTSAARDLISFLDEPGSSAGPSGSGAGRHSVRRTPHGPRGVAGARARRSNMHFSSSGGLSSLSPSARETVDPIAELLSQLSGVRRSATGTTSHSSSSNPTQLQQLQMQLQLERQQAARQQLERLPRRQTASTNLVSGSSSASGTSRDSTSAQNTGAVSVSVSGPGPAPPPGLVPTSSRHQTESQHTPSITFNNQFLLSTITDEPKTEQEIEEEERLTQERSEYMIEVLFSSLTMSPENLVKCMEHFENFRREKQDRIVSEPNIEVVLDELPVNNNLKSDNNETAINESSMPDVDTSQTISRNESSSQNSNESVLTVPALSNDTMKPQYYEQPSQGSSVPRSRVPRGRGRAAQEQRQQLQTNNPSNSVSTISTSSSGSKVNEINSSNASGPSTSNNPRSTTKVNGKPKSMHQSTKSAGTSR